MIRILLIIGSLTLSQFAWSQGNSEIRKEVVAVIDSFFSCLHSGDTAAMHQLFTKKPSMRSVVQGQIRATPFETFLMAVGRQPRENKWEEKLWTYQVDVDAQLASVWTEYSFYVDDNLQHCGANHFLLIQQEDKSWKISDIIDTRKRGNCRQTKHDSTDRKAINAKLDQWHQAAADADADVFFGTLTADGIYLGTDISERWLRDEFKKWAGFAFERETAWDFTPKKRSIYFYENDPNIAWFEETLDTWMGDCRGSGVMVFEKGEWYLKHYNLAVAVPNDAIDGYLKVIGKPRKKK